jgi:hypothetical protein
MLRKCFEEIDKEPAGMTAFLSSNLLSCLAGEFSEVATERVCVFVMDSIWAKVKEMEKVKGTKGYDYDKHTAFIQVIVAISTAVNGIESGATGLARENRKKKAKEIFGSIDVEFGLGTQDVVFEKSFKLFC